MSTRHALGALALAALTLAGCQSPPQETVPPNTLVAAKVSQAPDLRALDADPAWGRARPLAFRIGDGVNFADGKGETGVPLKDLVREATDVIERMCIEAALNLTNDNRASAAEMLGLSRQSLYVKLRRYNLGDLGEPSTDGADQA